MDLKSGTVTYRTIDNKLSSGSVHRVCSFWDMSSFFKKFFCIPFSFLSIIFLSTEPKHGRQVSFEMGSLKIRSPRETGGSTLRFDVVGTIIRREREITRICNDGHTRVRIYQYTPSPSRSPPPPLLPPSPPIDWPAGRPAGPACIHMHAG